MLTFSIIRYKLSENMKTEPDMRPYSYGGVTVDPRALPLDIAQRDSSKFLGVFNRDPEMGAGEKTHQERMAALDRLAGVR